MTSSNELKNFVVIPLRLQSKRLPEKIIREIHSGKSLSQLVIEKAQSGLSHCLENTELIIAVDHKKTQQHLENSFSDLNIILTDPQLPSGSDRVHSALRIFMEQNSIEQKNVQSIINLQGDMPFFDPKALKLLQNAIINQSSEDRVMATLCQQWPIDLDPQSLDNVKVVCDRSGRALYFSRFPIPCSREYSLEKLQLHIGLYAYTLPALTDFCRSEVSCLEKLESLEQLRALDLGIPIQVVQVEEKKNFSFKGVDSSIDLSWAKNFFQRKKEQ